MITKLRNQNYERDYKCCSDYYINYCLPRASIEVLRNKKIKTMIYITRDRYKPFSIYKFRHKNLEKALHMMLYVKLYEE